MSHIKATKLPGSALQTLVNIRLTREDYHDRYTKALQKLAQRTNLQGFRPGKVPVKLVEKLSGNSVFAEEIMRIAQDLLFEYLNKEKIEFLFTPLVHGDKVNLNPNEDEQVLDFEIGVKPEINLDFLQELKLSNYNVTISDDRLQDELYRIRKSRASSEKVEQIGEQDLTCVTLEYTVGEERKNVTIWLQDLTKKVFVSWKDLQVNSEIKLDLEKDLLVSSKAEWFAYFEKESLPLSGSARVVEIRSLLLPELDSKFFSEIFPNNLEIKTEEDCLQEIRRIFEVRLISESQHFLETQINQELASQNQIPLPEDFIKRWMEQDRRQKQKEDKPFTKDEWVSLLGGIRRQLIVQKLIKEENIQEADSKVLSSFIEEKLVQQFQSYNLPQETRKQLLNKAMDDEDYVDRMRNEYMDNQAMQVLIKRVQLSTENIDEKQFREITGKYYKKIT